MNEKIELEMKKIINKLEVNELMDDWIIIKNMIINYITLEWTDDCLPTSDELLNVCCSIINNPNNHKAKHIASFMNKDELEIMTCCLWKTLDEFLNDKKGE